MLVQMEEHMELVLRVLDLAHWKDMESSHHIPLPLVALLEEVHQ